MAEDDEDYNKHEWEKPAWAKNGPKLKSTGKADAMKAGNLAKEITLVNANKDESRDTNSKANADILKAKTEVSEKDVSWEKPSWAKDTGLKSKGNSNEKDTSWEKPAWAQSAGLKSTAKGSKLAKDGNLAKPITFPKGK